MRMCPGELRLRSGGQSLVIYWRTLHPRQRGFLHLGDALSAFKDGFVIGRDPFCQLPIDHETIAPRHVRLVYEASLPEIHTLDGEVLLYDYGAPEHVMRMRWEGGQAFCDDLEASHQVIEELEEDFINLSLHRLPAGKKEDFNWYVGRGLQRASQVFYPEMQLGCYFLRAAITSTSCPNFFPKEEPTEEVQEAKSIKTNSERLEALSKHPDPRVQRELAQNPSTPPKVLRSLLFAFPEEVLRNPTTPLCLLEDASFLNGLSEPTIRSIFEVDPPEWFVNLVVSDTISTKPRDSSEEPLYSPAQGPAFQDLPISLLAAMYRRSSPTLLKALSKSQNPKTREALQRNPSAIQRRA
jgi:hypothetical protein